MENITEQDTNKVNQSKLKTSFRVHYYFDCVFYWKESQFEKCQSSLRKLSYSELLNLHRIQAHLVSNILAFLPGNLIAKMLRK